MKKITLILLALLFKSSIYAKQNYSVNIENNFFGYVPLEDWKNPGRYSRFNVFDENLKTILAVKGKASDFLEVKFQREITITKIRIAGGLFKSEDLFYKNNRPREIVLSFFNTEKNQMMKKSIKETTWILEDKMVYQELIFEPIVINRLVFGVFDIYKGSKYNDTCVSEVELYNGNHKYKISNIESIKKNYVKNVHSWLLSLFNGSKFELGENLGYAYSYKNGDIKYQHRMQNDCMLHSAYPDRWKVVQGKLYMRLLGKWKLVEYLLRDQKFILLKLYNSCWLPMNKEGDL